MCIPSQTNFLWKSLKLFQYMSNEWTPLFHLPSLRSPTNLPKAKWRDEELWGAGQDKGERDRLICRIFVKSLPDFPFRWEDLSLHYSDYYFGQALALFLMVLGDSCQVCLWDDYRWETASLWAEEGNVGIFEDNSGALCLCAEGLLRKSTEHPFLGVQISFLILQPHQSSPPEKKSPGLHGC